MTRRLTFRSLLALAGLLLTSSQAEITLVDSVGFANATGSTEDPDGNDATRTVGADELGAFDANGVAKLVVIIGGEGEGNGSANNTVTGVTYGGVAMIKVLDRYGNGNRGASMWYLDDISVSGEFVITFEENQSGLGFGAYALNGTLPGFAQTANTTAVTASDAYNEQMEMTIALPGELIVAGFARNNFDDGGGIGIEAPLVELFYGGTDGSSAASAYQFVESPGTVIPTIYKLTNGVGAIIAASFQPAPVASNFHLLIRPTDGSAGRYDFEWDSQDGKLYDLVSATNLSAAPDTWPVWEGQMDLAATPPTNTLTGIPGSADPRRFFAVMERDAPPPPPLLSEDFEGGATPAGWLTSGTGTTWSVGTPNGDGGANTEPSAAAGGTFCAGTNMNDKYANSADARLVTSAFTVPVGGATLELSYYIDTEASSGGPDFGTIRLLNAADGTPLAGGEVASDLQGTSLSWNLGESLALPAVANGLEVKLEFGFVSDDAGENWAGFYIDDVVVTAD